MESGEQGGHAPVTARKRRMPRWQTIVAVGLFAFFGMVVYGVVSPFLPRRLSKAEVVDWTGIALPKSARVVGAGVAGFMEEFYAKIEMDPTDVDAFVAPLTNFDSVSNVVSRKTIIYRMHGDGPSWWDPPESPKRFVSFSAGPSGRRSTRGLVVLDNKRSAVLYMHNAR